MRIVVAPDKFKGSVTAREAAAHLAAGIRDASPEVDVVELPVADGGEGTLDAALEAGFTPVSYTHLTLPTTLHECRSRWSPYH